MSFAAYLILRVRDTHIVFLRLLFLVGVICPLMQEHSLRLKKLISQAREDAMLKIRRPVCKRVFKSNHVLRADRKKRCKSNLSKVSVLADRSLHQDVMHSRCLGTTASDVCLQALTLSLPSPCDFFTFSLPSPCDFFTLSSNREAVHRL